MAASLFRSVIPAAVMALLATQAPAADDLELARALIESERFQEAVPLLKRLGEGGGATPAQLDVLAGRIYLGLGKPAKAAEYFEHAAMASLDDGEASLGLAEASLALGDVAKARRHASAVLRQDPDLVEAHLVLARADERLGNGQAAYQRLRKLRDDRPDDEQVAVLSARFAARRNGPAAGIDELRRFTARHPEAAAAHDALGLLQWGGGQRAEGFRSRELARKLYAGRGEAGRAEAVAAWLKAVDYKPEPEAVPVPEPPKPAEAPPPVPPPPRAPVEAQPVPLPPPPAPPPPRPAVRAAMLARPEALPFAPGSPIMTGSGVVLEGGRQIVTNRHVVEGQRSIAVRNGTGHVRTARVVKLSDEDDLALLEIDQPFPDQPATPLADIVEPAPGRAAIVMGFPMIGLFGDEQPALTEGIVAKTIGLNNDANTFQMTAKINKGNSGGPVFDRRGRLIGVAMAKVDNAALFKKDGTLVEDINVGVKGGRILRFLGRKPGDGERAGPEMNLEDLYQAMLPRAVLVAGQK